VKKTEMDEACRKHGEYEKCIQDLIRKPKGKKLLGRHRRRWYDDIRTGLSEIM